jgi:pyruvate/2-oxoglutarate dehydrogenase complex dihydrolipoamide dehydrogenase (E3) component
VRSEILDLLIIGAGPTGLSAADEATKLGLKRVVVLERESEAGGTPRHCGHLGFGMHDFKRLYTGPKYAERLRQLTSGLEVRCGHVATEIARGGRVEVSSPQGPYSIIAQRVLMATGVYEKTSPQRLMPGARPFGILTTGALQRFVYLHRRLPCLAPVVVGSQLIAYSTILTLRHMGAKPVAIIEPETHVRTSLLVTAGARLIFGVPTLSDARISDIQNGYKVETVTIERHGARQVIHCDGVIFTGDWIPEATLARTSHIGIDPATNGPWIDEDGRTHDRQLFAAGNVIGSIRSSGACAMAGRRAARTIFKEFHRDLILSEEKIPSLTI